ncbi:MAG: tyrosine-type recombinase/integrase [Actinomyces sp.]|nr:tyrosine-type recombinase/integrase [Actinomyces sp.]
MARRAFGNVEKLPSGNYRARFSLPTGERIKAPRTFTTKAAAYSWLSQQQTDLDRGEWKHPAEIAREQAQAQANKLGAFAPLWFDAQTWQHSTRKNNEAVYANYIKPAFKDTPLTELTHQDVAHWLENLEAVEYSANKNRERGKASPHVRGRALRILNLILEEATDRGFLDVNPLAGRKYLRRLTKPKAGETVTSQDRRLWDVPSVQALINEVPKQWRLAFLLMAVCGLRVGEVIPLRVEDIDLKAGVLHVTHTVKGTGVNRVHREGAKTAAGVRSIALAPAMVEEVKAHVKLQGITGRAAWLFPSPRDATQCVSSQAIAAHSKVACKRLGFDGYIRPHELRHAVNTHAQHVPGVSLYDVKAYMGHARGSDMTMHYSHTTEKQQQLIAEALAALYLNPVENLIKLPKAANHE